MFRGGLGVQYKEKRLLLESSERRRWKGAPIPLASSLTQPHPPCGVSFTVTAPSSFTQPPLLRRSFRLAFPIMPYASHSLSTSSILPASFAPLKPPFSYTVDLFNYMKNVIGEKIHYLIKMSKHLHGRHVSILQIQKLRPREGKGHIYYKTVN